MIRYLSLLRLILGLAMMPAMSLYSQTRTLDSLENLYLSHANPRERIFFLKQIFEVLENSDPNKALLIAKTSLNVAEQSSKEDITNCLNLVGIAHYNVNQRDSALSFYQKAMDRATLLNDSLNLSKTYNNLAVLQFDIGNYELALEYMKRCAEIEQGMKNYSEASLTYSNLGGICAELQKFHEAEEFLNKALEQALRAGNSFAETQAYHNFSGLYLRMGDYSLAKEFAGKKIAICESSDDYSGAAYGYFSLATIAQFEMKHSDVMLYGNHCVKLAKLTDDIKLLSNVLAQLAMSASELGRPQEAYDLIYEAYGWKDTLANRENRAALIEMEKKYESEETKKENQILQQQNSIAHLENEKSKQDLAYSRIIIFSSIGGLLLLIGLAFALYNRNKLKQRANEKLSHANELIKEKNDDITASLEYASKIQEALLPTKENTTLFTDAFFMLKPKDIVSGDFFWYTEKAGKKIFTAVDCTGHGVPGAFMSMIGNTFLHEIINEKGITKPSEILNELRSKVVGALSKRDARKDGMDMAICALDEQNLTLEFAGANNPLYLVQDNEMKEIKADKQPVGLMAERNEPFNNHEFKIKKGDKIYVFSDGYADQFGGPKGKKFKYKQLKDLLFGISEKPMTEQREILLTTFNSWKGDLEQVDDVCLIGVRV